jgi:sorbitol/mannitol transport system substrate-binding protein
MRARWIASAVLCLFAGAAHARATNLVVATVDNAQMLQMQRLTPVFEQQHPGIKVRWVILPEGSLRRTVATDITTQGEQFDIVTVGLFETPLWARRGWLQPLRLDAGYDTADLLRPIREGLSWRGELYAAPFYGESSMLLYRKDLLRQAGLRMPAQPTWSQVAGLAAKLNDPAHGVHGICLRARPGWGENMSLVTTMVNSFGGQWFDMGWRPQLLGRPWLQAVGMYVDLLRKYGPADAADRNFNGNLALFEQGDCAMWVDASVAAGFVTNPGSSKVADDVGFAPAPVEVTARGSHWLWAWALAIPADVDAAQAAAARSFIEWATSRDYVRLVAQRFGWGLVPSGTRDSTYADPRFQAAAPWAHVEWQAIESADPRDATLPRSPYTGVQMVEIAGFPSIGDEVGRQISLAVRGEISTLQALRTAQAATQHQMLLDGYR